MSGVGRVVDEVRMARMEAGAANAQAESAKEMLHAQIASFFAQVEASAERAVEMMEGCVQQLVAYSDV